MVAIVPHLNIYLKYNKNYNAQRAGKQPRSIDKDAGQTATGTNTTPAMSRALVTVTGRRSSWLWPAPRGWTWRC